MIAEIRDTGQIDWSHSFVVEEEQGSYHGIFTPVIVHEIDRASRDRGVSRTAQGAMHQGNSATNNSDITGGLVPKRRCHLFSTKLLPRSHP
jgi:hypothetical protein